MALLALRLTPQDRARSAGGRPWAIGTSALVAVGGVAVLTTAVAVVDIGAGHHGDGQEVHGAAVSFR